MMDFSALVFRSFAQLIQGHGFVPAERVSSDRFAALVARPSAEVCYYLLARKYPTGGVAVCLWVAPPDSPDDSLDRLFLGFKIDLGEGHDDAKQFLEDVARRAELLVPHLGGIEEATRQEIARPIMRTKRLQSYTASRSVYSAIRSYSQTSEGRYCLAAFEKAKEVAGGRAKWDELEAESVRVCQLLLRDSSAPPEILHEHFRKDPKFLGRCLTGALYIEALVPFPNS